MQSRSAVSYCLLFTLACAALVEGRQKCYWQDRTEATTYFPCNEEANDSACCFQTDVCLSNGYCLQQSEIWANRIGTPACTDPSWNSGNCPTECKGVSWDSAISLFLAHDTPDGSFCCSEIYDTKSQSCPKGPKSPFNLASGIAVYNRTDGSLIPPNISDPNATLTPGAAYVATQTQTATVSASAVNEDKSNSNIIAIAAGIAVPLAVLLLGALVACGFLWHQVRRLKKQGSASASASSQSMVVPDAPKDPSGIGSPLGSQQPAQYGELDGYHINEVPATADPVEVHGEHK